MAGSITANLVRFLRYNLIISEKQYMAPKIGEMDLHDFLLLQQPEYYVSQSDNSVPVGNTEVTPYWSLIRKLVLKGSLDEVWAVLSRHSACKRCCSQNHDRVHSGYFDKTLRDDAEAFGLIKALLLSAPIPGGRDFRDDDGLGKYIDEDFDDDDQEELLDGFPRDSYKQWETDSEDFEINITAVEVLHNSWKNCIVDNLKNNIPLRNLSRRLPLLQTCLWDVILKTKKCYFEEDSWAERLAAELIYMRPQTFKEDIYLRVADHIELSASSASREEDALPLEDTLVKIMKGDALEVIKSLNAAGGESSAALPSTMSALQCNSLVESGMIEVTEMSYNCELELLIAASTAILSSFTIQGHNGAGVMLCIRLLHPHILPENSRIVAYAADLLCRHWPESDTQVMNMLSMCEDSVKRGSRRLLEACDSIAFSRCIAHQRRTNTVQAVYFLMRGIEYVSFFPSDSNSITACLNSMCYRKLTWFCANVSQSVLETISACLMEDVVDFGSIISTVQSAKAVVDGISFDKCYEMISSDPSVCLMKFVTDIGSNLIVAEFTKAANCLIECFKERKSSDGSVIVLAHCGLYGHLLSIAYNILEKEDEEEMESKSCAFDVAGIQILFCRYMQYNSKCKVWMNKNTENVVCESISPEKMRAVLGRSLMRAFVVQNLSLRHSCEILPECNYDELTEQRVDRMLGPSV